MEKNMYALGNVEKFLSDRAADLRIRPERQQRILGRAQEKAGANGELSAGQTPYIFGDHWLEEQFARDFQSPHTDHLDIAARTLRCQ